jgi:antitoxin component YwqK of YwqJK toxin-antitoxin module
MKHIDEQIKFIDTKLLPLFGLKNIVDYDNFIKCEINKDEENLFIKKINDPNFVGIHRTYYDSGVLRSEVFVNAGKKEGIYKSYVDSNLEQLREEVNFINDIRNGIFKSYHSDGKIWQEGIYINNKRNGIYKTYYKNGKLATEVNYIDDKMNGIYKTYDWNGQLDKEVNYIDGKLKN